MGTVQRNGMRGEELAPGKEGRMNELALFAGAGGGILGGKLLGWRTVCAVEWDAYAASVLVARQNDGTLDAFPIWDDVQTFDGRPWRGIVDVVSGGFPCQDISAAGKGAGIEGERSGMWKHMARIIGEVRPKYALVENSPMLTSRGLGVVLGDLASLGYDAKWGVLGAIDVGAPHKRERIWIMANTNKVRELQQSGIEQEERKRARHSSEDVSDTNSAGLEKQLSKEPVGEEYPAAQRCRWWEAEPGVGRVVDGMASRVDRLACLGNGQVPAVVRLAWEMLKP